MAARIQIIIKFCSIICVAILLVIYRNPLAIFVLIIFLFPSLLVFESKMIAILMQKNSHRDDYKYYENWPNWLSTLMRGKINCTLYNNLI
jgi:hypothetical protein